MHEEHEGLALLSFDFQRVFPHKCWISDWSSDDEDPSRFRYKLLSARNVVDDEIELLVVLQEHDGTKEVLKDLLIKTEAFQRTATVVVNGLAAEYGLDFEEQDFTACTTPEKFETVASAYGWDVS